MIKQSSISALNFQLNASMNYNRMQYKIILLYIITQRWKFSIHFPSYKDFVLYDEGCLSPGKNDTKHSSKSLMLLLYVLKNYGFSQPFRKMKIFLFLVMLFTVRHTTFHLALTRNNIIKY